jgi:hypothetical protein
MKMKPYFAYFPQNFPRLIVNSGKEFDIDNKVPSIE